LKGTSKYPNLDRKILLEVLGERINDKKFLKFMRKRLNLRLFDTKTNKFEQTFLGIPQGGVDSPYLWNIYLLGMDKFIIEHITKKFDEINIKRLTSSAGPTKGMIMTNSPVNKLYQKQDRICANLKKAKLLEKEKLKRKKDPDYSAYFKAIRIHHKAEAYKRTIRYYDPNRQALRFKYIRYADDWIILTNAPKSILLEIKKDIAYWLLKYRKAKLSEEKTIITDMRKRLAHFLGFELKQTTTRRTETMQNGVKKRTTEWQVTISPDRQRLINRMYMKGYCTKDGFPKEISWLSTLDAYTIIQKFNQVMEGLSNFYAEFITYPSSLYRWLYIVRWSAIKTLAQKYHTNCSGIFNPRINSRSTLYST
jgi:hypothetical protein